MFRPLPIIFLTCILTFSIAAAENTGYSINKHITSPGDTIGETSWSDNLLTNGGSLAINKNLDFDSQNQKVSEYNIQTQKVLTYTSTQGAHLLGEESYTLSTAGLSKYDDQEFLRCVYATNDMSWMPSFCNTVQVKTSLININNAQISQTSALRMVGDDATPAALNYQIAVTPDTGSGSSHAEGIVTTMFAGTIREARDNSTNVSGTNQWKDSVEVIGGISNFQKSFAYQSGLRI